MSGFKKTFTGDNVISALSAFPDGLMLAKLQEKIGCSEMTLRPLLTELIEAGRVQKINIGASERKPTNIYKLVKI